MSRPGFAGDSSPCEVGDWRDRRSVPRGLKERAVRLVREHHRDYGSQYEAIRSATRTISSIRQRRFTATRPNALWATAVRA